MTKENNTGEYAFGVVVLLVLVGFLWYASQGMPAEDTEKEHVIEDVQSEMALMEPPFSFEEVFYEVRRLDGLYGTDFRNESPMTGVLREQAAKEYIARIDALRTSIMNQTVPEQDKYIQQLLNARENVLLSGIYYQRAMGFGREGVFRQDINCEDREAILQATYYFNQTRHYGGEAMYNLDLALRYKPARNLIGINENKPAIYSQAFKDIGALIEMNIAGLNAYCYEDSGETAA